MSCTLSGSEPERHRIDTQMFYFEDDSENESVAPAPARKKPDVCRGINKARTANEHMRISSFGRRQIRSGVISYGGVDRSGYRTEVRIADKMSVGVQTLVHVYFNDPELVMWHAKKAACTKGMRVKAGYVLPGNEHRSDNHHWRLQWIAGIADRSAKPVARFGSRVETQGRRVQVCDKSNGLIVKYTDIRTAAAAHDMSCFSMKSLCDGDYKSSEITAEYVEDDPELTYVRTQISPSGKLELRTETEKWAEIDPVDWREGGKYFCVLSERRKRRKPVDA